MLRRIKNGDKMPPNGTTDAKFIIIVFIIKLSVIEKEFI
jgi:hypothetical protein